MLHTVFSNSYEVLREALYINVSADNCHRTSPEALFKDTEVVVPSQAVGDALRRFFADRDGICAGVAMKSIGQWFIKFGRPLIGMGEAGSELEFLLWKTLESPGFVESYPRLQAFLEKKTPAERYGFAMHVAAVFSRYSTYRLDWVLQWMGVKAEADFADDEKARREKAALHEHPDYGWQKGLWQELKRSLSEEDKAAEDLKNLARIEDKMTKAGAENRGETVHIFMPFMLPPLILPMLKKLAEGEFADEADVYLYLLNPSSEYWYESLPRGASSWKTEAAEPVLAYLRRNVASTRAVIERVYAFLNEEGAVPLVGAEPESTADDENPVQILPTTGAFDPVMQRLQDLKLSTVQEKAAYYVTPGTATFLKSLQSVFLTLSLEPVREAGEEQTLDGSVVVCRAPGLIREVENLVDWLQSVFVASPDLRPEDVLVVTPDINAAAGVIEAVMSAQPSARRLPWTVVAPQASAVKLAVESWERLVKLLFSRGDRKTLEVWLEHPLVLKRWQMTAADLAVIHRWLKAGGYRFGFSDAHVAALCAKNPDEENDTDGTLSKAVERLTLAFLMGSDRPVVLGDVTTADGDSWKDGVVENAPLFERLAVLADRLEAKRAQLAGWGDAATPEAMKDFLASLAAEFLDFSDVPDALSAIQSSLAAVTDAMERTLGSAVTVVPEVFAKSACAHVADVAQHRTPSGITFAGMADFRGLPFRVVAVLGLNRDSAFPGFNRTEEFDLMAAGRESGVTARRGDRDSRLDNRNIFFDLFMAARDRFFVSYSEGYEKGQKMPPSVVVEDFLAFIRESTGEDGLAKKLMVRVPLTAMSRRNYAPLEEGGRPWRSPDERLLAAVEAAEAENFSRPEAVFAQGAEALLAEETTVGADAVVKYFTGPDRFVLRCFGVSVDNDEEKKVNPVDELLASDDKFAVARRRRREAALAMTDVSQEDLLKAAALNPENGAPRLRETALQTEIECVCRAVEAMKSLAPAGDLPAKMVSTPFGLSLRFPLLPLFQNPSDETRPLVAIITFSDTDRRRVRLMQCLRNAFCPEDRFQLRIIAADMPNKVVTNLPDFSRPVDSTGKTTYADAAAGALLSLFATLARRADVVPPGKESPEAKLLWRGEEERIEAPAAKNFIKALEEFFGVAHPDNNQKNQKNQNSKKAANKSDEEDALDRLGKLKELLAGAAALEAAAELVNEQEGAKL